MSFKVGAYRSCITPPFGLLTGSNFGFGRVNHISDEVYAHAVYISNDSMEAVFISLDICSLNTKKMYVPAVEAIQHSCGIDPEHVFINTIHNNFDPADFPENAFYYEYLIKMSATAASMAKSRAVAGRIYAAKGENPRFIFNRRLRKPGGGIVQNHCGDIAFMADCIDDAVVDPQLTVLKLTDLKGNAIAFITNYCLHNKANDDEVSSDYSGVMEQELKRTYGKDVVLTFMPGASGDVNFIDYKNRYPQYQQPLYKVIGKALAGTVMELESEFTELEDTGMQIQNELLLIEDRPFVDYDLCSDTTFGSDPDHPMYGFIRAAYEKHKSMGPEQTTQLNIKALRIGEDFALLAIPALVFNQVGLDIKSKSDFKFTFVCDTINGSEGYIPTLQAFEDGGYEVRKLIGGNYGGSHLAIDACDRVTAAAERLFYKLHS